VDINVHPTKQEIKFEDEKIVYAFVKSAVKHALAQFSITPTLDFGLDPSIQHLEAIAKPFTDEKKSAAAHSPLYSGFTQKNQAHFIDTKSNLANWQDFYSPAAVTATLPDTSSPELDLPAVPSQIEPHQVQQFHGSYLLLQNPEGYLLVHQQNAHERVLYEKYSMAMQGKPMATQQSLFPATIDLSAADAELLQELLTDLQTLGYQIEAFGKNSFVIQGTPADVHQGNEKQAIEKMLEQYKNFSIDLRFTRREKLLRSLALQQATKAGTALSPKEAASMLNQLFACQAPNITPNGKPTYHQYLKNALDKMFGR
jgi:DNA mismatch repair protein MutL